MTLREAHAQGRLKPKPRTVEHWLASPDLRQRWRTDLLLERVGGRWYTTPARIEKWRAALVERDRKTKTAVDAAARQGQGHGQNNPHDTSSQA